MSKAESLKQLRHLFCGEFDVDCRICPFTDRCYDGHNGLIDFINEQEENNNENA